MLVYLRTFRDYLRNRSLRLLGVLMSLNDPQWGRRPNQGPPDLDEIWRDFNRKLGGLFGRRGGGAGGEPPDARKVGGGAGLLAILVLLVWLASGFYIVYEGQRGVVLRFGRLVETTMPGPRWHLPYPIESAEVVNVAGVRSVEVGYRNNVKSKVLKESLMLTDDENIVDVQFAIQYTLKSPEDFLFNNRNPEDNVLQAAETAIREVVGKSKMDFVLNQGRSEVASRVKVLMQQILETSPIEPAAWLASAALALWSGPRAAIIMLVVGGFFIFPATELLIRAAGERAPVSPANALRSLGMQIAFVLPLSMPLLLPVGLYRLNWFYPAMMILLGAHYLPFVFLYGMRMFAVLASVVTVLLFGWAPALHAVRGDLRSAMHNIANAATSSPGGRRTLRVLVAGEFALAPCLGPQIFQLVLGLPGFGPDLAQVRLEHLDCRARGIDLGFGFRQRQSVGRRIKPHQHIPRLDRLIVLYHHLGHVA